MYPYVRVIGLPVAVDEASRRIRMDLSPQNRITLKIDIPWNFHSYIIGKSGHTIQPVVRRTGVSVHFPDGNKMSDIHKSNQVSINCRGNGVNAIEEARGILRSLTPLIFSFVIPASPELTKDSRTSYITNYLQSLYHVQINLTLNEEGNSLSGWVRGAEWDAERVKEATLCLLQFVCGDIARHIQVQTSLEISPHYHQAILGHQRENVRMIESFTCTKICFPDLSDQLIHPLSLFTVTIFGSIHNVYIARAMIIGSLPISLMFEWESVSDYYIRQICQSMDIDVSQRVSDSADMKSFFIIKGRERNAANVYEAWRQLTQAENVPNCRIPPEYFLAWPEPSNAVNVNAPQCQMLPETLPHSPVNCNSENSPSYRVPQKYYPESPDYCNSADASLTAVTDAPNSSGLSDIGDSGLAQSNSFGTDSANSSSRSLAPSPDFEIPDSMASMLLKIQAYQATKKPIVPVVRHPTSSWSGKGLSKSHVQMPTENTSDLFHTKPPVHSQYYQQNAFVNAFSSLSLKSESVKDVKLILIFLNLEQYVDLFEGYDIDLDTFFHLMEEDLVTLGVRSALHRETILMAAKKLRGMLQMNDVEVN